MNGRAHPDDILIVATQQQVRAYINYFEPRQVFTVSRTDRLEGLRFRNAWYTPQATCQPGWARAFGVLRYLAARDRGRVQPIEAWTAEEPTLADKVAALAERMDDDRSPVNSSYRKAINDVLGLLAIEAATAA